MYGKSVWTREVAPSSLDPNADQQTPIAFGVELYRREGKTGACPHSGSRQRNLQESIE